MPLGVGTEFGSFRHVLVFLEGKFLKMFPKMQ